MNSDTNNNECKEMIIISNSCLCFFIHKKVNINKPYNNPLVGSIILNDAEYVKLCSNLKHYFCDIEPIVNMKPKDNTVFEQQTGNKYYNHDGIKVPYPILHLDDIEIHYIHEKNSCEVVLKKVKRRLERFRNLIKTDNYEILNVWSHSEHFTNELDNNYSNIIDEYMSIKANKTFNIYLGPEKYNLNTENYKYYIHHVPFDNVKYKRDNSYGLTFNNQPQNIDLLSEFINNTKDFH